MRAGRSESRLVRGLVLCLCSALSLEGLSAPLLAQVPPDGGESPVVREIDPADDGDLDATLEAVRINLKNGEYDQAVAALKPAIAKARSQLTRLREAYLLLIKTYVYQGNSLKSEPDGLAASEQCYREAKRYVVECLTTRELRHTQPKPASDYPPEMLELFSSVRAVIFGAFRVRDLLPPDAVITVDGDTLRFAEGQRAAEIVDLTVGMHQVVVQHPGYRDLTEEIHLLPGEAVERTYELTRRGRSIWYTLLAGVAVGGVAAALALSGGEDESAAPPGTLPEPPDPPSLAR